MADPVTKKYVECGFRSSYAGPFECRNGDMQMAVLEGDRKRIGDFVDLMLNGPADGVLEYKPVSDRVLLLYGYNLVSSSELTDHGKIHEDLVTFWIPLWENDTRTGKKRLCMTVPFILVDNPLSHITGREVLGFAKALGRFERHGEHLNVWAYGGPTDPDARAGWFPFLELGPSDGHEEGADEELDRQAALEVVANAIEEGSGEELAMPGMKLISELVKMADKGTPMIFLKQLRDSEKQNMACYQAIVESISEPVGTASFKRPGRRWDVKINEMDSHPIGRELGIFDQETRWSVKMTNFNFNVLPGRVIAP
jgi:hypothetical protein